MKPSFLQDFLGSISKTVLSRLSWVYVDGFVKTTVNLDAASQELIWKVETGQIVFDGPYDQNYTDYCNCYHDDLDRITGVDEYGDLLIETTKSLHQKFYTAYINDQLSGIRRGFEIWRVNLVSSSVGTIVQALEDFELSIQFCRVELAGYTHISLYHDRINDVLSGLQNEVSILKMSLFPSTHLNSKTYMEDTLPVIVILTALKEEYNSVHAHLDQVTDENKNGTLYEKGYFGFDGKPIAEVIIRECGQNNAAAAQETERAIRLFRPDGIFFVGIAGSRKPNDFAVGDVVVANKIYSYEGGKAERKQLLARPDTASSSNDVIQMAAHIRRGEDWKKMIKGGLDYSNVKADVGIIASGEKLIEHFDSATGRVLTQHYNDTQVVEMEGFGFAKTAQRQGKDNSHMLIGLVRGISDILETKTKAQINESPKDKRPDHVKDLACSTAAAFTYFLIYKLFVDQKKKSK